MPSTCWATIWPPDVASTEISTRDCSGWKQRRGRDIPGRLNASKIFWPGKIRHHRSRSCQSVTSTALFWPLAFLLIHIVPGSILRSTIVGAIGERSYTIVFSLLSVATLVWMVMAFNASDSGGYVWYHAGKIQYVSVALMFLAFVLGVGGLIGANPTAVGGRVAKNGDPATGFLRITRHPFLVSVVIWSIAHLLVRGELRAIVFFGGLGLLAAVGTVLIDRKSAKRLGEEWHQFSEATSIIPFLAILQGPQPPQCRRTETLAVGNRDRRLRSGSAFSCGHHGRPPLP